MSASKPVLVIVSGAPGAGKSTLAKRLGAELALPVIDRDDIKDSMFDSLGWSDREWSIKLGRASWELLFGFAETVLRAGSSVIVDSNFERGAHPQLAAIATRTPHTIVEVHCTAPAEVLARRFVRRWNEGGRHRGHATNWDEEQYRREIADRYFVPLEESDVLIEVDTDDGKSVDFDGIVRVIRRELGGRDGSEDG